MPGQEFGGRQVLWEEPGAIDPAAIRRVGDVQQIADHRGIEAEPGHRPGAEVTQVSNRYDFNAVTGAIMQPSPYTLLRLTAAYDVRPNVELFARAENVLNQVYEEPEGFQAPYFQAFFGIKAKF